MSYLIECNDKKITIKDIYKENNNWIIAVKNYLKENKEINNENIELKNRTIDLLVDMEDLFDYSIIKGINIFSKLTFDHPWIDEIKNSLNYEILDKIKVAFNKFNLGGLPKWLSIFKQSDIQTVLELEDIKEITDTLQLIAPYFEDFDMFAKYDKKGKKDPFVIDLEKTYENFYLFPIFNYSLTNKCNIKVTKI
jgi:hypothetical protein